MLDVIDRYVGDRFLRRFYDDPGTWRETYWHGVPVRKCPMDLWVFQEIIVNTRPELIIEAGTYRGGSALFMASICDMLDQGRIVTIDTAEEPDRPGHARIQYVTGSSTDPEVVSHLRDEAGAVQRVMVVLDSDHSGQHVLEELRSLGPLVTAGCYLIVEDTIVNGHPILRDFGPGPTEAVGQFLAERPGCFVVDRSCEKFHISFNPGGYLRRLPSGI